MPTAPTVVGRNIDFTGCRLKRGTGLSATYLTLSGAPTLDANESGSSSDFSIIYRQGGTGNQPGTFVQEPNGLGDGTLAWLKKPYVTVTAVTRDPANAQGLQASQTVALYGTGGAATADAIYNRRGKVWSRLSPGGDALLTAAVSFTWKRERYDLIEADGTTGQIYVIKGTESDFNAADLMPQFTPGRIPLYRAYVYNDTVELIKVHDWSGDTPANPLSLSLLNSIRSYNQGVLAPFLAKCALGGTVKIIGYTDSTGMCASAVEPFADSPLVTAGNGSGRDETSFWSYAMQLAEFAGVPVTYSFDGRTIVKRTAAWAIVEALQLLYPSTTFVFENWGIGGTNLDDDAIAAPGARWSNRINAMMASAPDLIVTCNLMNELSPTNSISLRLNSLVTLIRATLPEAAIVMLDCNALSADNANPLAWRTRLNENNRRVARSRGCAYVNYDLPIYDRPGYYGISTQSFAAQNRWNHPQDYEMQRNMRMAAVQLGLTAMATA